MQCLTPFGGWVVTFMGINYVYYDMGGLKESYHGSLWSEWPVNSVMQLEDEWYAGNYLEFKEYIKTVSIAKM